MNGRMVLHICQFLTNDLGVEALTKCFDTPCRQIMNYVLKEIPVWGSIKGSVLSLKSYHGYLQDEAGHV